MPLWRRTSHVGRSRARSASTRRSTCRSTTPSTMYLSASSPAGPSAMWHESTKRRWRSLPFSRTPRTPQQGRPAAPPQFWLLLTAAWRLWPLVGVVTYNFVPHEHRVLFVDAIEIAYSAILSTLTAKHSSETDDDDILAHHA
mmetsp:Transcript_35639/g.116393  ORF Transcript_35639/g.116393 Transcript_35639/m.116393 type:complete len:142 (+) Transcript_35639:666-1091(+)